MSFFLAGLVLCHIPAFALSALYPRDDQPLQPIRIPLSLTNQQYVMNVAMSSGPQVQNLPFVLSTATGYTSVAGTSCSSCGSDLYNTSASTSAHQLPQSQDISMWSGSTSGSLITEDCSLKQGNGSPWKYTNQTILVANQSQTIVPSSGFSGVVGLGSNARDGNFGASFAGNWLSQNPTRSNFTYAFALDSPRSGTNGGMLHLLAQDNSSFQGDVTWKPMSDFNSSSTNSDWSVNLDGWSFQSGGSGKISQSGDLVAVLDPFFATIRFPQAQARSIYSSLNGATIYSNSSDTITWIVPCDTKMSFTFTFGNFITTLDQTSLLRSNQQGQCISYIEAWTDNNVNEYVLGASFISAVYLIFNLSGASGGSVGIASRTSSSKMSAGTIVAIVMSTLAFTVALVIAAMLAYRWWKKRQAPESSPKEDHHHIHRVTPYFSTDLTSEATALMPLTPPTPPQDHRASALYSHRPESQNYPSFSTAGESTQYTHLTDSSTYYDEATMLGTPPPYGGVQFPNYRPVHVVSVSPPADRKSVPRESS
ncbi:aspartic peptidase domain-containing protein [Armillaria luteobubalina]|uniref:Aspartic peptidase domain-containing protein n=1 Tax=Armillaria luteobubalina TaxID=153913 RepID=A0AA39TZI4_9AGAR|nr:aspartic peptidase domain-containing protein [Armillaria luteobubalina]